MVWCRHAMNSSDLESGISLPQVSVMLTMQTQALYAVLRDFDLANSRQGLSVDEAASLQVNSLLRGGKRGQSLCKEHVSPGRRPSTPLRIRCPGNLLGLPLAGGGAVQTVTTVVPLVVTV